MKDVLGKTTQACLAEFRARSKCRVVVFLRQMKKTLPDFIFWSIFKNSILLVSMNPASVDLTHNVCCGSFLCIKLEVAFLGRWEVF